MKQFVLIGFLIMFIVAVNGCINEIKQQDVITTELERLNIETTGFPNQMEITLPVTLSDANWGLKKIVCKEGGYDLSPYAGKTVVLTSFPIGELYNNIEPLNVWVITTDDKIVCVYKTVREGSSLVPGVFPIN